MKSFSATILVSLSIFAQPALAQPTSYPLNGEFKQVSPTDPLVGGCENRLKIHSDAAAVSIAYSGPIAPEFQTMFNLGPCGYGQSFEKFSIGKIDPLAGGTQNGGGPVVIEENTYVDHGATLLIAHDIRSDGNFDLPQHQFYVFKKITYLGNGQIEVDVLNQDTGAVIAATLYEAVR